jgi:ceramide glucosyltransferase
MVELLSDSLVALAVLGLVALAAQLVLSLWHRRRKAPAISASPPSITILKPLAGLDDGLDESLALFATLDYPSYEVVLGVKDASDPALGPALRATRRWPERFRLVLQRGEPGLNPKVNQLISMERAARHELLVISDSNARVGAGYLRGIAGWMQDPDVGCVTHPVVGAGDRRWGSRLDNLHLATSIGPGMIAAKVAANQDVVVGKSMALWRADLTKLGGFEAYKDVLAEDYVFGRAVRDALGKRVVVANEWVVNHSADKSITCFMSRYCRWSVIHRTALHPATYSAQILLNPIALATLGGLLSPSVATSAALAGVIGAKIAIDLATAASTGRGPDVRSALAVPLKDLLLFAAWVRAFFVRHVSWRGHRLRVMEGSRLVPDGLEAPSSLRRWRARVAIR